MSELSDKAGVPSQVASKHIPRKRTPKNAVERKPFIADFAQILAGQLFDSVLPSTLTERLFSWSSGRDADNALDRSAIKERVHYINPFLPIRPAVLPVDILEKVIDALANSREIAVEYRHHAGEFGQKTEVCQHLNALPLGMVQNATHTLLVYREKSQKSIQTLVLNRVVAVVVGRKFVYPKTWSMRAWVSEHFLGDGGVPIRLIFRIDAQTGEFLYDSPLSADQQIFTIKKKMEVHATVQDSPMIDHWLQSFGSAISKIRKERIV